VDRLTVLYKLYKSSVAKVTPSRRFLQQKHHNTLMGSHINLKLDDGNNRRRYTGRAKKVSPKNLANF